MCQHNPLASFRFPVLCTDPTSILAPPSCPWDRRRGSRHSSPVTSNALSSCGRTLPRTRPLPWERRLPPAKLCSVYPPPAPRQPNPRPNRTPVPILHTPPPEPEPNATMQPTDLNNAQCKQHTTMFFRYIAFFLPFFVILKVSHYQTFFCRVVGSVPTVVCVYCHKKGIRRPVTTRTAFGVPGVQRRGSTPPPQRPISSLKKDLSEERLYIRSLFFWGGGLCCFFNGGVRR